MKFRIFITAAMVLVWGVFYHFYVLAQGAIESQTAASQLEDGVMPYAYSRFMAESGILTIVSVVLLGIPVLMWGVYIYKQSKVEKADIA